MIDLARLHPARVARSARHRLKALADKLFPPPPVSSAPVVETRADTIKRMTLEKLAGRVALPELAVIFSDRQSHRTDATYHRDGAGYVLELPTVDESFDAINRTRELGHAYLYWLMHCPPEVEFLSVTLSDGDAPSGARFAPSTNLPGLVPIPDPYFFRTTSFQAFRELADAESPAWADRSTEIIWRGTSAGHGTFDPVLGAQCPGRAAQRLELILAAQRVPGVDAALSNYGRREFRPEVLEEAGLLRAVVPEESWVRRKFAIDVDGWTNTWSNLMVRMLLGCCVLKLDSKFGYRQWYYDRLLPWEHYVPVKADASDLAERVEWVRGNDARAAEIAANGQRLARSLTFEVGRSEAIELITRHWRG
jgi:hypothetical protein